jgi:hypothetical protein
VNLAVEEDERRRTTGVDKGLVWWLIRLAAPQLPSPDLRIGRAATRRRRGPGHIRRARALQVRLSSGIGFISRSYSPHH